MMSAMRLLLASASPRRAELLRAAGFSFDTLVVDVDETPQPGEAPSTYVRRLAMEKSARGLALVHGPAEAGHVRGDKARDFHGPATVGHYVRRDARGDVRGDVTRSVTDAERAYVVSGF